MPQIALPTPPLSDDVVLLRPWESGDVAALTAACADPEVSRWTMVPSSYSERDAREFIARGEVDRRTGRELSLAIVSVLDGRELLGSISLARLDWADRKAEVGYWVARESRRRGVGTRAARLLSRWALRELPLERIELLVNPANEASQRLAERAGFQREGVLRGYRRRKGEREDLVMYALLAEASHHGP